MRKKSRWLTGFSLQSLPLIDVDEAAFEHGKFIKSSILGLAGEVIAASHQPNEPDSKSRQQIGFGLNEGEGVFHFPLRSDSACCWLRLNCERFMRV